MPSQIQMNSNVSQGPKKIGVLIDEFEEKWKFFKEDTIEWLNQFKLNVANLP